MTVYERKAETWNIMIPFYDSPVFEIYEPYLQPRIGNFIGVSVCIIIECKDENN